MGDFMLDRASLSINSQNFMEMFSRSTARAVNIERFKIIQLSLLDKNLSEKFAEKQTHVAPPADGSLSTQFSTGNTIYPSHSFPTLGLNPRLQISLLYLDHPFRFSQRIHYRPYQRIWRLSIFQTLKWIEKQILSSSPNVISPLK